MRLRLSGHDCLVSIQSPLAGVKMCAMSGHLEWINLYRAALRETDPNKLQTRIEEAERAMRQALRSAVEYEDRNRSAEFKRCRTIRCYTRRTTKVSGIFIKLLASG